MADNVENLLAQRGQQWGDAIGTHVRIAKVWDGIANREEITALKVALMMEGLKLIRGDINPDDPDSFDDAQDYGRIAQLIAGHRDSLGDKKLEAHRNTTWLHALQDHRLVPDEYGYSCTCGNWSCGKTTGVVEFDIHIVEVLQNTEPSDKMPETVSDFVRAARAEVQAIINGDPFALPDNVRPMVKGEEVVDIPKSEADRIAARAAALEAQVRAGQTGRCPVCGDPRLIYHNTCGTPGCEATLKGVQNGGD